MIGLALPFLVWMISAMPLSGQDDAVPTDKADGPVTAKLVDTFHSTETLELEATGGPKQVLVLLGNPALGVDTEKANCASHKRSGDGLSEMDKYESIGTGTVGGNCKGEPVNC